MNNLHFVIIFAYQNSLLSAKRFRSSRFIMDANEGSRTTTSITKYVVYNTYGFLLEQCQVIVSGLLPF